MRLIFLCLLLPGFAFSQQTLNAEQFFALNLSDQNKAGSPIREAINFPWIDRYELRTETHDFDLDQQEYTLRLSPSSRKIRKAQKALYETKRHSPDFDGQEIYCDFLLALHLDWLSLFILSEQQSVMDKLLVLLNDKQTIYLKMAETLEFDPQNLLKLQKEKSDIEIELHELKLEQDFLLSRYDIHDHELDFGDFATIEKISAYLDKSLLTDQTQANLTQAETAYKKELLIKEIELESAEKKRLLDFVQVKYNGPNSDLLEERLSVGLGLQLSTSGSSKLKMQELQIEKEELDRKLERNQWKQQEKLNTLSHQLQTDIQAFLHFQNVMTTEKDQLESLSNKIAQKEGISPLFLLDVAERHLSMKSKSLNKKEDVLRNFLKFLHQSGEMCQSDFVN